MLKVAKSRKCPSRFCHRTDTELHASFSRKRPAEVVNRSVRVRGLPAGTQEGLLQQALEKIVKVERVEVFEDKHEAVAELETPAVSERPTS